MVKVEEIPATEEVQQDDQAETSDVQSVKTDELNQHLSDLEADEDEVVVAADAEDQ